MDSQQPQMSVDTRQLLCFSKHYLRSAKRLKCRKSDVSKTIAQLYEEYPHNNRSNVYLLMAHLASAAYRMATIIEKYKPKLNDYNYRHLQRRGLSEPEIASEMRNNLERYMPMMLRDLVGHDLNATHELAKPRARVVQSLNPKQCMNMLQRSIRQIEEDLTSKRLLHSASSNRQNGAVRNF